MKSHVWRPLYIVIAVVAVFAVARPLYVPADFGIHEGGYMYGWYRAGNIDDWKKFAVKYKDSESCKECHSDNYEKISASSHAIIQCENCHGPALEHPTNPPKLAIERTRELCLRCHAGLPYPTSGRKDLPAIDPDKHEPGVECVKCHNPHEPA